jgi:VCBS repeat-containing protein
MSLQKLSPATSASQSRNNQFHLEIDERAGVQAAKLMSPGSEPLQWQSNLTGSWSHGWFSTDSHGKLSLELDPDLLVPLASNQQILGQLALLSSTGQVISTTVQINGCNSPSVLKSRKLGIHEDQQQIMFHPRITDADGAAEAMLKPVEQAAWKYGSYSVNQSGELLLMLDRSSFSNLPQGKTISSKLSLTTVDGTMHPLTVEISGVNDKPQVGSPIRLQEAEGSQQVKLAIHDADGPAQSALMPNQAGNWTHGTFSTDEKGLLQMSLTAELQLPQGKELDGRITLYAVDQSLLDCQVDIIGRNAPSRLISNHLALDRDQQSISLIPDITDPDGPAEAMLTPGQCGRWQFGTYMVTREGELSVFLDQGLTTALSVPITIDNAFQLRTLDQTKHQISIAVGTGEMTRTMQLALDTHEAASSHPMQQAGSAAAAASTNSQIAIEPLQAVTIEPQPGGSIVESQDWHGVLESLGNYLAPIEIDLTPIYG